MTLNSEEIDQNIHIVTFYSDSSCVTVPHLCNVLILRLLMTLINMKTVT